ncbi:TPA: O158 family O-antigen polymerase, partial [Escherichia coli]|nr:O158 family O-antigen polymerase [Escherichia coli]
LMIFSSTQFVFFMIIIIAQFFSSNLISRKAKIFLLILVLVGIVVASHEVGILINYISNKLDGFITGNASNASASERNKLLLIGVNAFLENPVFGGGLASFYNYVDTGLVNFHLQTLQQLGIFGYLLFVAFLLYPLLFFKRYTLEIKLLFILTWFTLFFSGSIWDSNLYLPYLFIAGKSNER